MKRKHSNIDEYQWQQMFEKHLAEFSDFLSRHGRFPKQNDDPVLNRWLKDIAFAYRSKRIKEEYIERLNAVGMLWQVRDISWWEKYREAKKCLVQEKRFPDEKTEKALYLWLSIQLRLLTKEKVSDYQKKLLTELNSLVEKINSKKGTLEEKKEKKWAQNFDGLILFRQQHPGKWPKPHGADDEKALAYWCRKQLGDYRNQSLPEDYFVKLNEIGFPFHPEEKSWNYYFEEVSSRLLANSTISGLPKKLKNWYHLQQRKFAGLSTREQLLFVSLELYNNYNKPIKKEANSFELQHCATPYEVVPDDEDNFPAILGLLCAKTVTSFDTWMLSFEEVKQFRKQNRGLWPRQGSTGHEEELYHWCQEQRRRYTETNGDKPGYLQQCIDELNKAGFCW